MSVHSGQRPELYLAVQACREDFVVASLCPPVSFPPLSLPMTPSVHSWCILSHLVAWHDRKEQEVASQFTHVCVCVCVHVQGDSATLQPLPASWLPALCCLTVSRSGIIQENFSVRAESHVVLCPGGAGGELWGCAPCHHPRSVQEALHPWRWQQPSEGVPWD